MRKIIKKNIYENFLVKFTIDQSHSSVKIPIKSVGSELEILRHPLGALARVDMPQIFIFHCGNFKASEWRQLKNKLAKIDVVIINQPKILSKHKMSPKIPAGPSMLLCFKKYYGQMMEISILKILQTVESFYSKNLILLYAQSNSTIFNHKDIIHISNFHSIKQLCNHLSNNLLFTSIDLLTLLNLKSR